MGQQLASAMAEHLPHRRCGAVAEVRLGRETESVNLHSSKMSKTGSPRINRQRGEGVASGGDSLGGVALLLAKGHRLKVWGQQQAALVGPDGAIAGGRWDRRRRRCRRRPMMGRGSTAATPNAGEGTKDAVAVAAAIAVSDARKIESGILFVAERGLGWYRGG